MTTTTHPPFRDSTRSDDRVLPGSTSSPIGLERFFGSFFQERNIRWMLMAGAAIVFGSSLMLVTRAWPAWENFPALKFLTILGYTITTWAAAEVGRRRLGLQATSTVLQLLTLSLLPVCYLSIHWLSAGSGLQNLEALGLLVPATAFLWFASGRTIDHLLQGRQTTFLTSYRLLCLAGALPAFSNPLTASTFFLLSWLVCSAGVVKVSRHAFWLAEQHRWPRVFAFVPVLLLACQFLVLILAKTTSVAGGVWNFAIQTHWLGFACVLIAATILATAKAAADVFRQRTGDLVRPFPWHLSAPLFCGLVVTVAGVLLSAVGFSPLGPTTYAIIPTAALAAALMGVAAKESRHVAFVWISLIFAAVAYQCSPTLASDVVRQLKQGVEVAIHEQRLPLAFYGITYLPLVLVVAAISRQRRMVDDCFLAAPLKHFATALAVVLFAAAVTSVKALFVVSLVNIGAFLLLSIVFADRRYVALSLTALVMAAGASVPALNGMRITSLPLGYAATVLTALATLLTLSKIPDRLLNNIPLPNRMWLRHSSADGDPAVQQHSFLLQRADGSSRGLCQLFGVTLSIVMVGYCATRSALRFHEVPAGAELLQFALLLAALLQFHLRRPLYLVGLATVLFSSFVAVRCGAGLGLSIESLTQHASTITVISSSVAYVACRLLSGSRSDRQLTLLRTRLGWDGRQRRWVTADSHVSWKLVASGLLVPLCDVCVLVLAVLTAVYHGPVLLAVNVATVSGATAALPVVTHLAVLWLAALAMLLQMRTAAVVTALIFPLWLTATLATGLGSMTVPWMLTVWAAANVIVQTICRTSVTRIDRTASARSADRISGWWLQGILWLSCLSFDLPLRLAAAMAIGCFLLLDRSQHSSSQRSFYAVMGNVQSLLLLAAMAGARGFIVNLADQTVLPLLLFGTTLSYLLFDRPTERFDCVIQQAWAALLRAGSVVLAAFLLTAGSFSIPLVVLTLCGFAIAAFAELRHAVRRQQQFFVWASALWMLLATAFLWTQSIIVLGSGISQFVLLGMSVTALVAGHFCRHRPSLQIVRRPLVLVGQALPAVVTGLAVVRELTQMDAPFRSANVVAPMMAAGLYFQQAMLMRDRKFAVAAGVVLNVALMLLWKSLGLQQLEFVLVPIGLTILAFVQLLQKDLPTAVHDPLRYLGALIILVAPTLNLFGASWGPSITLLMASVLVILLSIGLRLRAPLYTGTAFLMADLVAMVLRSHDVYPFLPWLCGIAIGVGLIALAAFCENHREKLLSRIRLLSAELATWN